jgi:hypothetical protein
MDSMGGLLNESVQMAPSTGTLLQFWTVNQANQEEIDLPRAIVFLILIVVAKKLGAAMLHRNITETPGP